MAMAAMALMIVNVFMHVFIVHVFIVQMLLIVRTFFMGHY
jgi:hypothetical protein